MSRTFRAAAPAGRPAVAPRPRQMMSGRVPARSDRCPSATGATAPCQCGTATMRATDCLASRRWQPAAAPFPPPAGSAARPDRTRCVPRTDWTPRLRSRPAAHRRSPTCASAAPTPAAQSGDWRRPTLPPTRWPPRFARLCQGGAARSTDSGAPRSDPSAPIARWDRPSAAGSAWQRTGRRLGLRWRSGSPAARERCISRRPHPAAPVPDRHDPGSAHSAPGNAAAAPVRPGRWRAARGPRPAGTTRRLLRNGPDRKAAAPDPSAH